ncbi:MAG: hypothetical protein WAR02_02835, partial [Pseudolabrys sp.]
MVFQHFNLFPHLSVLDNCTLAPIWVRKMPKKLAEDALLAALKVKHNHPEALISYGRKSNRRGDRRNPHRQE